MHVFSHIILITTISLINFIDAWEVKLGALILGAFFIAYIKASEKGLFLLFYIAAIFISLILQPSFKVSNIPEYDLIDKSIYFTVIPAIMLVIITINEYTNKKNKVNKK